MPRFCSFSVAGVGELNINPLLVRYIRANGKSSTVIYFDDDHKMIVNEPLYDVTMRLDAALNHS